MSSGTLTKDGAETAPVEEPRQVMSSTPLPDDSTDAPLMESPVRTPRRRPSSHFAAALAMFHTPVGLVDEGAEHGYGSMSRESQANSSSYETRAPRELLSQSGFRRSKYWDGVPHGFVEQLQKYGGRPALESVTSPTQFSGFSPSLSGAGDEFPKPIASSGHDRGLSEGEGDTEAEESGREQRPPPRATRREPRRGGSSSGMGRARGRQGEARSPPSVRGVSNSCSRTHSSVSTDVAAARSPCETAPGGGSGHGWAPPRSSSSSSSSSVRRRTPSGSSGQLGPARVPAASEEEMDRRDGAASDRSAAGAGRSGGELRVEAARGLWGSWRNWTRQQRSGSVRGENPPDSHAALQESSRQHYSNDGHVDPRNFIINMIIKSQTGSVELRAIEAALSWGAAFADVYGPLTEYLHGYQTIFVVSPVDDRVALSTSPAFGLVNGPRRRCSLGSPGGRRTVKSRQSIAAPPERIGSISYSAVAEHFDLAYLEQMYRNRGYTVVLRYGMLHVSDTGVFDLFAFETGTVVWWGMKREDHWMVDEDFLDGASLASREAMRERFAAKDIAALFPVFSSYELDEGLSYDSLEEAEARFSKFLRFDHYLIPAKEPLRTQVMLTVSCCLGRSAVMDLIENMTQWSHVRVLEIPSEPKGVIDHFRVKRQVAQLEGELRAISMVITELLDQPDFLWEMPWLRVYAHLVDVQATATQRKEWFIARSHALYEQINNIKERRYRLFMLGSDVFLIGILVADVIFMLTRLVMKMYFRRQEEEAW